MPAPTQSLTNIYQPSTPSSSEPAIRTSSTKAEILIQSRLTETLVVNQVDRIIDGYREPNFFIRLLVLTTNRMMQFIIDSLHPE